jgi:hypothetical protein
MSIIFNPGEPINNGIQTVSNGLSESPAGNAILGGVLSPGATVITGNDPSTVIEFLMSSPDLQNIIAWNSQFVQIQTITTNPVFDGSVLNISATQLQLLNAGTHSSADPETFFGGTMILTDSSYYAGGATNKGALGNNFVGLRFTFASMLVQSQYQTVPNRGLENEGDWENDMTARNLITAQYLTPTPVNDSLGIFTNADCEAALPNAVPGRELIGLTVLYKKISAGTWINYPYTACL